jgi:hypothetical protein
MKQSRSGDVINADREWTAAPGSRPREAVAIRQATLALRRRILKKLYRRIKRDFLSPEHVESTFARQLQETDLLTPQTS